MPHVVVEAKIWLCILFLQSVVSLSGSTVIYSGAVGQMSKLVVTPGASKSNGRFTNWFDHYKCAAALNKCKDDNKILWL